MSGKERWLIASAAAWVTLGVTYMAAGEELTTLGLILTLLAITAGMAALAFSFIAYDVLLWVRLATVFTVGILTLMAALGYFGTMRHNPAEQASSTAETARGTYTDAVIIYGIESSTSYSAILGGSRTHPAECVTIGYADGDVVGEHAEALTARQQGNECLLPLSTSYSVLAFPFRDGENALGELKPNKAQLVQPLDNSFSTWVFVYDPAQSGKAKPLPDWANASRGCSGCLVMTG